jgi:hypothetical protein
MAVPAAADRIIRADTTLEAGVGLQDGYRGRPAGGGEGHGGGEEAEKRGQQSDSAGHGDLLSREWKRLDSKPPLFIRCPEPPFLRLEPGERSPGVMCSRPPAF